MRHTIQLALVMGAVAAVSGLQECCPFPETMDTDLSYLQDSNCRMNMCGMWKDPERPIRRFHFKGYHKTGSTVTLQLLSSFMRIAEKGLPAWNITLGSREVSKTGHQAFTAPLDPDHEQRTQYRGISGIVDWQNKRAQVSQVNDKHNPESQSRSAAVSSCRWPVARVISDIYFDGGRKVVTGQNRINPETCTDPLKYACKRLDGHLKWTEKLVRLDYDRGLLFITYDEVVADKVHVLKKFGRWLGFEEAELESLVPEFQRVADFLTPSKSKSKSKPGKAGLTLDESHFRSGDASYSGSANQFSAEALEAMDGYICQRSPLLWHLFRYPEAKTADCPIKTLRDANHTDWVLL